MLYLVFLLQIIFIGVESYNVCCPDIGCFTDDPPFAHHTWEPMCPEEMEVSTRVYTRENKQSGQVITRKSIPPAFKAHKRTIFVVHGWVQSKDSEWLHDVKDELLARGDYNVIITGWSGGSQDIVYWRSVSNTKVAGAEISMVARNLLNRGEITRQNTWCIGHSLGSHVCGFAGKRFKFGRITALDPAGPHFDGYDARAGLQSTDADFVDAMHTHGTDCVIMCLGTMRALGDVDYYPNRGGVQPGCLNNYEDTLRRIHVKGSIPDPINPTCSHLRAIWYFHESVKSYRTNCPFKVTGKCSNTDSISESCPSCNGCQVMGFDADQYQGRGLYYLTTNGEEPFCKN